jgi:hypothetical protein
MYNPTTLHWAVVKRILRYLKGSLDFGITIQLSLDFTLHVFSDSDWTRCPDDKKSTTGYLIFLGPNLISLCSEKQPTVSRSSMKAVYRSLAMAFAEIVWLKSLLQELSYSLPSSDLWCDNLGVTLLASNSPFHARTKHIELIYELKI